jgi:hypothetical protein
MPPTVAGGSRVSFDGPKACVSVAPGSGEVKRTVEPDRGSVEAEPEADVPVKLSMTPANGELPTSASLLAANIERPLDAQLGSTPRIQPSSWEMRAMHSV